MVPVTRSQSHSCHYYLYNLSPAKYIAHTLQSTLVSHTSGVRTHNQWRPHKPYHTLAYVSMRTDCFFRSFVRPFLTTLLTIFVLLASTIYPPLFCAHIKNSYYYYYYYRWKRTMTVIRVVVVADATLLVYVDARVMFSVLHTHTTRTMMTKYKRKWTYNDDRAKQE